MVAKRAHAANPGPFRQRRDRPIGATLLRAWVGYRRRLDEELTAAGFPDRALPDGRVLKLCVHPDGTTISAIGRELGITRQGASKIVAALHRDHYVTLRASTTDAREKIVRLAPRAIDFLAAKRQAKSKIDRELHRTLGPDSLQALHELLVALGADQPKPWEYLRASRQRLLDLDD